MEEKCIALCDFTAMRPDELGFFKGDLITVVAKGKDSGFWEGRIGERRGLFPNCFVSSNMHPTRAPALTDLALALFKYIPQGPTELSFDKHDILVVRRPCASPGWFYGTNMTQLQKQRKEDPMIEEPEPLMFPSNYVTCNLVRAQYAFTGRQRCELSIVPGDVIIVHRRWNDGWWEGSVAGTIEPHPPASAVASAQAGPSGLASSGSNGGGGGFLVGGMRRGIFPSNYTTSNVSTLDPPLFCKRCRTVFQPKTTACRECARNEEIVRTMMTTLDDFARGIHCHDSDASRSTDAPGSTSLPPLDLFSHVDVEPGRGKGALLAASDVKESTTVRPRLAV
jgi:hypothetical protein